jgi:hypothetical protein
MCVCQGEKELVCGVKEAGEKGTAKSAGKCFAMSVALGTCLQMHETREVTMK